MYNKPLYLPLSFFYLFPIPIHVGFICLIITSFLNKYGFSNTTNEPLRLIFMYCNCLPGAQGVKTVTYDLQPYILQVLRAFSAIPKGSPTHICKDYVFKNSSPAISMYNIKAGQEKNTDFANVCSG